MPKKSSHASHVELRGRTYFAVLYVPKDVQATISKTKFSRSTETGDRALAERRAHAFVLGWKAQIEAARFEAPDPLVGEAVDLYRNLRRKDLISGTVEEIIEERAEQIAVTNAYGARAFEAIAKGAHRPLSALLPDWIQEEISRGLARKTVDQMLADVTRFAEDFRSANLIDERTATIWTKTIAAEKDLSASSVTRIVGFCRNFFRYLVRIGEVAQPASEIFIIPTQYRKSKRATAKGSNRIDSWVQFTDEEAVFIHAKAQEKRDQSLVDLIFIGAYSGARIEEICALRCSNVSTRLGYFKIVDAKTKAGIREVPIHPKIQHRVTELVNESSDGYLLSNLTPNKYGHRSNAIGKRFGRLKTELGFGSTHVFHSIRKTFVTQLENAGINENITADIVGHEKPRITYGVYSGGASLKTKKDVIQHVSYEFKDIILNTKAHRKSAPRAKPRR